MSFGRFLPQASRAEKVEARQARLAVLCESVARNGIVGAVMGGTTLTALPKEGVLQSPSYERAAKALGYCMRCGWLSRIKGDLDFCHADCGKGQGFKTDSRRGWPGCRSCHEEVSRHLAKPVRRAVEYLLGLMTRHAVNEASTWPKRLPDWKEV